ncbi:hypothetical protein Tco_0938920 [Tanacetum coccineum]|uniref:Uncharacterized protein n=1 Tax=Tanacetum coccineum TaxID=301880 RepID=A0ABQ5DJ58_9ASTR
MNYVQVYLKTSQAQKIKDTTFGKLLEEIHVTWTQFGKKRDKIAALHEVIFKECVQETASGFVATPLEPTSDGVKTFVKASKRNRLNETLEDLGKRRHDIIQSVISCEIAKATWTDLIYSFEGPSNTKENRIMDLKLEYQTFRAKPSESLLQTYTHYKTLLNDLANDGVTLSKHKMNVGFMNSLLEKWPSFSQGLRNANHTQTLDLVDIYGRFVYEDNLISMRYSDTKKALITTSPDFPISTAFFSNNIVHDFQEILMMRLIRELVRSTSEI